MTNTFASAFWSDIHTDSSFKASGIKVKKVHSTGSLAVAVDYQSQLPIHIDIS